MSKPLLPVLFLLLSMLLQGSYAQEMRPVIIAGKIENYQLETNLSVGIDRLGMPSESAALQVDSAGNFRALFETAIPTSVWIGYRTNFQVIVQPGDSLHIAFDGRYADRAPLLSTAKYTGDRAKTNSEIAQFQALYYADELYHNWDKRKQAVKEYDVPDYLRYNDSIRQKSLAIYNRFVAEHRPGEESRRWARFAIEDQYYNNIFYYPLDHQQANNVARDSIWALPADYFDITASRLPLSHANLANAYALNNYARGFKNYALEKLSATRRDDDPWHFTAGRYGAASTAYDSVYIEAILRFVPDSLLKELMLTDVVSKGFEKQDVSTFERFRDVIDQHVQLPFLRGPLLRKYGETRARIDNPQLYSNAVLHEARQSSAKAIFDTIIASNRGKVIYIDFWATWCGPCLAEFPNAKQVEEQLPADDVAFVYLCIESDRDKYVASLSDYKLGGQHYFLSKPQSADILDLFKIKGIPFYVLIDQDGTIQHSGNHIRPFVAKPIIEKMIKHTGTNVRTK